MPKEAGEASDKDFGRFLNIALGSLYEVLSILDILNDNEILSEDAYRGFKIQIERIARQLGGLKEATNT